MTELQERIVSSLINKGGAWYSRREIALMLGLRKTPYIVAAIEGLVNRGVLQRETFAVRGLSGFGYRLVSEALPVVSMFPEIMFNGGQNG